jgi:hypothetical protein
MRGVGAVLEDIRMILFKSVFDKNVSN